jgi:general secretion pathway protein N
MTIGQRKVRHVMTAAMLAIGLIVPARSQQELAPHQAAADPRGGQSVAPAPARELQRLTKTRVNLQGRGNPLWNRPLTSFAATRERPLFSPTRRAPSIPMTAPGLVQPRPAVTRPPLSLVGAIVGEKDGMAIFVEETTKDVVRLRTGESHQGWILRSVQRREVTLERDRQITTLGLDAN